MLERNWKEVARKDREEVGEGRSSQYVMYSHVKLKTKFELNYLKKTEKNKEINVNFFG